jgi:2-amino-4-hydroxy-6-hydroxymethyldihydropteridine diphosphokinase
VEKAAIGIGSNLGDSVRTCLDAIEALRNGPAVSILKTSSFFRTRPVGFAGQNWFVNAAVLCETALEPQPLLDFLLELEKDFGRVRTVRWGPRTLDLDIIFFGSRQVDLPGLQIPHPRMHERLFVLAPLAEVEPEWVHPALGLSVDQMRDRLLETDHGQEIQKLDVS